MGLMDNMTKTLTNLLFVTEEKEAASEEAEHETSKKRKGNKQEATDASANLNGDLTQSPSVDKYRRALLDSIQKGKQASETLCLPFMKTLQSLEPTISDEPTRFKVALTSGEQFGVTPKAIIASSTSLKSSLSQEEQKFTQSLEREVISQVNQEEAEVAELEKSIVSKNESIQILMKEIEELKKEKIAKLSEINDAKIKIETISRDFTQAYQQLLNDIDGLVQKVNLYGGGNDGTK